MRVVTFGLLKTTNVWAVSSSAYREQSTAVDLCWPNPQRSIVWVQLTSLPCKSTDWSSINSITLWIHWDHRCWLRSSHHWTQTLCWRRQDYAQLPKLRLLYNGIHEMLLLQWGPCALHHWIQSSMEAILACHPAVSTEWLAGWQFRIPVYYDVWAQPPLMFPVKKSFEKCKWM